MDEHLRLSDAERERAAADLGGHYAEGRLTTEEHAERLDRVWAARTRGELGPVFRDLPGAAGLTRTTARTTTPARPGGPSWRTRRPPVPLFPLLVALVLVAALTPAPWLIVLPAVVLVLLVRGSHRSRCAG